MKNNKFLIIVLVAISTLASVVMGVNYVKVKITNTGNIQTPVIPEPSPGLEIFWEQECLTPVTEIAWGQINVGGQKTKTVYLKNTGDLTLTLSLITENWNPSNAEGFIDVSWDKETSTISKGQILQAQIVLKVSASITGISDFSFSIVISGSY